MRIPCGIFLALLVFVQSPGLAATSYHIGNSLTWDSQPGQLKHLASQDGHTLSSGYHINCAQSLESIWNNPDTTCVAPVAEYGKFTNALANYAFDFVTMQPHPQAGSTLADDTAVILDMIDLARTNPANSDTKFFIYSAWPQKNANGYAANWTTSVANEDTTSTIHAREYFNHLIERVRNETDATVHLIPVGEVLFAIDEKLKAGELDSYTGVNQFYRDNVHLSEDLGRYTASVTTYATLFGENPAGLIPPTSFGLTNQAAIDLIHETVWEVVSGHQYSGVPEPGSAVILFASAACLLTRRQRSIARFSR